MKANVRLLSTALAIVIVTLISAAFPASTFADYYYPPGPMTYGSSYAPYSSYAPSSGCTHIVGSGETLYEIARRYHTSASALAMENDLGNPNLIYWGMTLRVPCGTTGYSSSCVRAIHVVQLGEDLFRIGLRYRLSWTALASFNGLSDPNLIYVGMRLLIPCSSSYSPGYSQASPSYTPSPSPSYTPTPSPTSAPALVTMQNIAFNPATITIHVGQTVTWRNDDTVPHTATSGTCPGGVCTPMPGWDSGTLNPGRSFSHTFDTAGTFTYYCRIHGAMMQGTVVVMP